MGLYYLRARYYNPATGRFLSRDPEDGDSSNPKTLHKYMYAGGDPVNLSDPSGRDFIEDEAFLEVDLGATTRVKILAGTIAATLCGIAEKLDWTIRHAGGRGFELPDPFDTYCVWFSK